MRNLVAVLMLAALECAAQAPFVPSEQQYLRFILLNIASLDHDPQAIKAFENQLVKLLGLTPQESAVLHSAGESLRPLLAQNRQLGRAIAAGKVALSASDIAALRELEDRREQRIGALASQVLRDVTPRSAARIQGAGRRLSAGVAKTN